MMDGFHIRIRLGRHHGKAVAPPRASDQDDILSLHAKLVLPLQELARLRRRIGLLAMRLKEGEDRDDAPPVLHRIAPHRLRGALDARVEHDARLPRLLESPRKLTDTERSDTNKPRHIRGIEPRNDERRYRFRIRLQHARRPIRLVVERSTDLDPLHDIEHLVISEYDALPTHGNNTISSANIPTRNMAPRNVEKCGHACKIAQAEAANLLQVHIRPTGVAMHLKSN